MAPPSVLSNVKAKLRIQFNMSEDRNTAMFENIKQSLDVLTEKADKGFGLHTIENDILELVLNLHDSIKKIEKYLEKAEPEIEKENKIKSETSPGQSPDNPSLQTKNIDSPKKKTSGSGKKKEKTTRRKQRIYTDEDKKYIADKNNPIESLMEKYGYDTGVRVESGAAGGRLA